MSKPNPKRIYFKVPPGYLNDVRAELILWRFQMGLNLEEGKIMVKAYEAGEDATVAGVRIIDLRLAYFNASDARKLVKPI